MMKPYLVMEDEGCCMLQDLVCPLLSDSLDATGW